MSLTRPATRTSESTTASERGARDPPAARARRRWRRAPARPPRRPLLRHPRRRRAGRAGPRRPRAPRTVPGTRRAARAARPPRPGATVDGPRVAVAHGWPSSRGGHPDPALPQHRRAVGQHGRRGRGENGVVAPADRALPRRERLLLAERSDERQPHVAGVDEDGTAPDAGNEAVEAAREPRALKPSARPRGDTAGHVDRGARRHQQGDDARHSQPQDDLVVVDDVGVTDRLDVGVGGSVAPCDQVALARAHFHVRGRRRHGRPGGRVPSRRRGTRPAGRRRAG